MDSQTERLNKQKSALSRLIFPDTRLFFGAALFQTMARFYGREDIAISFKADAPSIFGKKGRGSQTIYLRRGSKTQRGYAIRLTLGFPLVRCYETRDKTKYLTMSFN